MKTIANKHAVVEVGLKHSNSGDKVILEVYVIKGALSVGDIVEWHNDTAEVYKYDKNSDYYSLSCSADGAFARELGNIITVSVIEQNC